MIIVCVLLSDTKTRGVLRRLLSATDRARARFRAEDGVLRKRESSTVSSQSQCMLGQSRQAALLLQMYVIVLVPVLVFLSFFFAFSCLHPFPPPSLLPSFFFLLLLLLLLFLFFFLFFLFSFFFLNVLLFYPHPRSPFPCFFTRSIYTCISL